MISLRPLASSVRPHKTARRISLVALTGALVLGLVGPSPASAEAPWWRIGSEVAPTNLPPGGEGQVLAVAGNLGDAQVNGSKSPVIITAKLPPGLIATAIVGQLKNQTQAECTISTLSCSFAGVLNPYEQIAVTINVKVEEPLGTMTSLPVELTVEGGGAPRASSTQHVTVNGEATAFGVQGYELTPLNEDGTPASQAGSHPFQLTSTLVTNQTIQMGGRQPVALPKDLHFNLPPGLIGNPNAATQCTMTDFSAIRANTETDLCPPTSVVGVSAVTAYEPLLRVFTKTVPVFNLVPAQGEPARFGFEVVGKVPIVIDTSVRTGRDYGVVASVDNATQTAGLLSSQVTFWGVPGDPRHNQSRGWECVAGGYFHNQVGRPCPASSEVPRQPFLTLPTSCPANPAVEPLTSSLEADSWAQPGVFVSSEYSWFSGTGESLGLDGCNQLPFSPAIGVAPEVHEANTPTGLSVDVQVPQKTTLEANGLAEADVRDTTVTFPAGVELSPSAANGLEACSEQQVGFKGFNAQTRTDEFTTAAPSCPDASKVGVVHIKTPLLSHELEGSLYVAAQEANPFGSLIALYIVAEDPVSGVLVKLAGKGELNENTLRVATKFTNTPQVPFEDLRIDLFGGSRASVSTPASCGAYGTDGVFTPWSGTGPVGFSSPPEEFRITSGAEGGGCAASPPAFAPGFQAHSANTQAGAFSPFELEITRPDADQALTGIGLRLPPGIAAMLSSVRPCSEPPAGQGWACGPESLIGHSVASSGLGSEPVTLGGDVYLTSGYDGAPFGLLVATPAKAGPFDLGVVDVRSRINVDPSTAAVTITSDPGPRDEAFPTQLKGIPVQLKRIRVLVDRPGFQFNPTNCSPMRIEGTLAGDQGGSQAVSSPFRVGNCQSLPFSPVFTASTQGQTSKLDGASLTVKVTSTRGQANIAKTVLTLPIQLPARLTTLQKACLAAVFEANPASCPEGSVIGTATVHTPVLSSPLSGPAYLVSHGNAAFPDVEFVLQGEGITLILDGQTDIKHGITTSSFNAVPDAPVDSFETTLPEGPHSALGATSTLCGQTLTAPTTITGQNGGVITQNTPVTVSGCQAVKAFKATRAQLLAKALVACRKRYKHNRHKRTSCERLARKHYAAKKSAHKPRKTAHHRRRP
jgi:hypothetical protein